MQRDFASSTDLYIAISHSFIDDPLRLFKFSTLLHCNLAKSTVSVPDRIAAEPNSPRHGVLMQWKGEQALLFFLVGLLAECILPLPVA